MQKFIVIALIVGVGLGIAGFGLGWFKFFTSPGEEKTSITLSVDRDKVKKDRDAVLNVFRTSNKDVKKDNAAMVAGVKADRDAFLTRSETRIKAMDQNLAELNTKAKSKSGFAVTKEKMNQAIGELITKTEAARLELQDLKAATPERWDALKTHLSGTLGEVEAGFEKVFARFMNEWTLNP